MDVARVIKIVGKTGIPDFILYTSDELYQQSAIFEVKTWWSYDEIEVNKIWTREPYTGGVFSWRSEGIPFEILKQVSASVMKRSHHHP